MKTARYRWGILLACCLAWLSSSATSLAGETRWFGGTERVLPVSLANLKDNGIRSNWLLDDQGATLWDFSLGTDVALWDYQSDRVRQLIGARFGINTRFEFGSESFDLWAADVRGGGAWGIQWSDWVVEAFFFHESSHLGDEILERGDRSRIDSSVNGVRLTVSRTWREDRWRTYGGLTGVPFAEPAELESFALHAGAEWRQLPPFRRGYLALETEVWAWREWNPEVTAQVGCFIGPRDEERLLSTARVYLQFASGRVPLGQFYNETESTFALGLALHW